MIDMKHSKKSKKSREIQLRELIRRESYKL